MTLAPLHSTTAAPAQIPAARFAGQSPAFTLPQPGALPAAPKHDPRDVARELVGQALLAPLVAQMRKDPFKSPLFHGGQGEDAFAQQLDQELVTRMTRRMDNSLVDAVYRRITRTAPSAGGFSRHG